MTVLIVAILGGRTKEEWYSQITDRVKQNYGYKTPTTVPQVYEQSRLNAFKVGQEARKAHQKAQERLGSEGDRDEVVNSSTESLS